MHLLNAAHLSVNCRSAPRFDMLKPLFEKVVLFFFREAEYERRVLARGAGRRKSWRLRILTGRLPPCACLTDACCTRLFELLASNFSSTCFPACSGSSKPRRAPSPLSLALATMEQPFSPNYDRSNGGDLILLSSEYVWSAKWCERR